MSTGAAPAISSEAVDRALAAFGEHRSGEAEPVASSVLNENFRVQTGSGVRFLRFVLRAHSLDVVEAEHRAIRFAASAGIPVTLPVDRPGGGSVQEIDGQRVALFPWVEGRTAMRGRVSPQEAAMLGDLHGRIQAAFSGYSDPVLIARREGGETTWDTARSLETLYRIEAKLSANLAGVEERHARRAIRMQVILLESGQARPAGDFDHLPRQFEHGDFQERNVILRDEPPLEALAVVDWERVRRLPRAFQLIRALDYTGLATAAAAEDYLTAFGRSVRLSEAECHDSVEQWWQSSLHNTWAYTAVFEDGNARGARFLPEIEPRLMRLADVGVRERLAAHVAKHCTG
jgi:Ser/Thr protein kinase RdoA (MazF antagonist)